MTTSTAETVPTIAKGTKTDGGADKTTTPARRNRTQARDEDGTGTRYFLAKANRDGNIPALDREVASEGEALVEALRAGVTYYAIQEFRVIPDFTGRRPRLHNQPVNGR